MSDRPSDNQRIVAAVWAIVAGCLLVAGTFDLSVPGFFYDEAIQAGPAHDFLTGNRQATHIPRMTFIELSGRRLPLLTSSYMGALKSHLLIPVLAVAGPSAAAVRTATLVWALLGLLPAALWAGRLYGATAAVAMLLIAGTDPALFFIARHDWGSFSLGLVCRGAGLYLLLVGWRRQSPALAAAAGLVFGLGIFNKIDFAAFLVAAAAAWLLARWWTAAPRNRGRLGLAAALAAGIGIGCLPFVPGAVTLAEIVESSATSDYPHDAAAKLRMYAALLDGSYFDRLMRSGGAFNWHPETEPLRLGLRGWLLAGAIAAGAASVVIRAARCRASTAEVWLVACAAFNALLLALMPDAARIHHGLNLYPLLPLVAAVGVGHALSRRDAAPQGAGDEAPPAPAAAALPGSLPAAAASPPSAQAHAAPAAARFARGLLHFASIALTVGACLGGAAWIGRTLWTLEVTGGKVYWSDALWRLLDDLAAQPGVPVVSVDWGFHEQLEFLTEGHPLVDASWKLIAERQNDREPVMQGGPEQIYLVLPPSHQFSVLSGLFLNLAAAVPQPLVEVTPYLDRQGEPAFYAIRFARAHQIKLARTGFEIAFGPQ